MAKSSSTPIEFSAKAYLIGGLFAWALAIVAFISALSVHGGSARIIALVGMVFWLVISVLSLRAWRAKR
jgi:hypothetical protein